MICEYEGDVLVIDKKLLLAVLAFASDDPTKPYCNTLRIERDWIAATDGYSVCALCVEPDEEMNFNPFTIDANWLRAELKSSLMKTVGLCLSGNDYVTLQRRDPKNPTVTTLEIESKISTEKFPDIMKVIPEQRGAKSRSKSGMFYCDPGLLVRLDRLVTALNCSGVRFQLSDKGPLGLIRFDLGHIELSAFGAIAPLRATSLDKEFNK